MQFFKTPTKTLGDLNADTAARLIAAAADIAFILDGEGVIQDLAFSRPDLLAELVGAAHWLRTRWADTVSDDSRAKTATLLAEAKSSPPSRWRQLNHPSAAGPVIPILYIVTQVGHKDRFVAIGRDMRGLASLQQRLVDAQMSMERDHSQLRNAETRYRMLFQNSAEPMLFIDSATDKIVEANPAAARLFGETVGRMIGRGFPAGLDRASAEALQSLLAIIRAGMNVEDVRIRLLATQDELLVSTTMFRQGPSVFYLMRFTPAQFGRALPAQHSAQLRMLGLLRNLPDGYVSVDPQGRVLSANPAFLHMVQVMTEDQVLGKALDHWLGRSGVDLSVLIANLKQHGSVTLFGTLLRGEFGATADVEISAVVLNDSDQPGFGLAIRNVGPRIRERPSSTEQLPRTIEQLKELIGRVSLKDMVRETTDVIERLCIEAALELTGDNRASAAEMLGLSRQSLYVKLRRYGLADAVEAPSASE